MPPLEYVPHQGCALKWTRLCESSRAFPVLAREDHLRSGGRRGAATINLRLAAVRRLAYEASDNGLLSPALAARIRRVKGAERLGIRLRERATLAKASSAARLFLFS
jgi:hypothetical protein